MVHTENKYEACLLDKENTWGKPTDEQEKIVADTILPVVSLFLLRSNNSMT